MHGCNAQLDIVAMHNKTHIEDNEATAKHQRFKISSGQPSSHDR